MAEEEQKAPPLTTDEFVRKNAEYLRLTKDLKERNTSLAPLRKRIKELKGVIVEYIHSHNVRISLGENAKKETEFMIVEEKARLAPLKVDFIREMLVKYFDGDEEEAAKVVQCIEDERDEKMVLNLKIVREKAEKGVKRAKHDD